MSKPVTYDAIVIGIGAMGAAACYHLARRGHSVLGIEQFRVGHDRGSSHGETRIIRRAYFEDPSYVPLLDRAYDLWRDLEDETETRLLEETGLVIFADPKNSLIYRGTVKSAEAFRIPMMESAPSVVREMYPAFTPPGNHGAVFEPGAGFLYAEVATRAHVKMAKRQGALINENESLISYRRDGAGYVVKTSKSEYRANRIVITGGSWNEKLLETLKLSLSIHRVLLYWFEAPRAFRLDEGSPCFMLHLERDMYYGFPVLDGRTLKIAAHSSDAEIRTPAEKDISEPPAHRLRAVQECIANCLPGVSTKLDRFATCIYTMTPDEHFMIDKHPTDPGVVFAAGFSGHGFKFAPVVGEILADLALHGRTKHPIDFLRTRRFKA